MRRDKHYALSLIFCEIAVFVAVSTFSQNIVVRAAVSLGGLQANLDVNADSSPPFLWAVISIFICATFAAGMMALRTWHTVASELAKESRMRQEEASRRSNIRAVT